MFLTQLLSAKAQGTKLRSITQRPELSHWIWRIVCTKWVTLIRTSTRISFQPLKILKLKTRNKWVLSLVWFEVISLLMKCETLPDADHVMVGWSPSAPAVFVMISSLSAYLKLILFVFPGRTLGNNIPQILAFHNRSSEVACLKTGLVWI